MESEAQGAEIVDSPETGAQVGKPKPKKRVRAKGRGEAGAKIALRGAKRAEARGLLAPGPVTPTPGRLLLASWRDVGAKGIRLIAEFLDAQEKLPKSRRDIKAILVAADTASKHALGLKLSLNVNDAALLRLCLRAAQEVYGGELERFAARLGELMESPDREAIEAVYEVLDDDGPA